MDTKPKKHRIFIALDLQPEAKEALALIQQKLKKSDIDCRWIKPANIHLTLNFLRYIDSDKIAQVKKALNSALSERVKFKAGFEGKIGFFPNEKHARIVWLDIDEGAEQIKQIQEAICRQLYKIGFKAERKEFVPHITLGRIKSSRNISRLVNKLNEVKLKNPVEFNIEGVYIYESILRRSGAQYGKIYECRLKNQ